MSPYPEHDKLEAVSEKSQIIGEFLEFVAGEFGWHLAEWGKDDTQQEVGGPIRDQLARYFAIDLAVLEEEKVAMLEAMRRLNDAEED